MTKDREKQAENSQKTPEKTSGFQEFLEECDTKEVRIGEKTFKVRQVSLMNAVAENVTPAHITNFVADIYEKGAKGMTSFQEAYKRLYEIAKSILIEPAPTRANMQKITHMEISMLANMAIYGVYTDRGLNAAKKEEEQAKNSSPGQGSIQ